MLPIRRGILGVRRTHLPRSSLLTTPQFIRHTSSSSTSTETKDKKSKSVKSNFTVSPKKAPQADMSQIPLQLLGCLTDFYIPPRYVSAPVSSWPKLLMRRIMLFALNTYSIVAFKRELGVPLKFDLWKDRAIEQYVRANKAFAEACNEPKVRAKGEIVEKRLDHTCGLHVGEALYARSKSFPVGSSVKWELVKLVKDPKIVLFNSIPDRNGVACFVQFVMKLNTVQKMTIFGKDGEVVQEKEQPVEDNLVFSLDPLSDELLLVGKLFESNHIRGLKPEIDISNPKEAKRFMVVAADIYRADPRESAVGSTKKDN
ncbi:Inner membrane mitoribosome receptor MBA1, mitochondrial [Candida viswanathii]|uniref:Inner membrane mitoribosome receptor MBA1, mitochondrial n=1 Tax=Candida viswanathii TaxID=5486 RepID=A0A367XX60_9ASCO|nr:Inner membrane mitoribosome receptor MBA1, mitochondrial [Candida viswanathii]